MLWVAEGEALWAGRRAAGPAHTACGADARRRGALPGARRGERRADRPGRPHRPMPGGAPGQAAAAAGERADAGADRLRRATSRAACRSQPRTRAWRRRAAQGEALFRERRGQLNLSCAQCHDDNAGRRLAGSTDPAGASDGYPLYRLEWQGLGSLQRRLRNCMAGVRSEPYPPGAPEYVALEALSGRARPRAGGGDARGAALTRG